MCFGKFDQKRLRILTTAHHQQIEDFLFTGYDPEDNRLPKVICDSCRVGVSEYSKGIYKRTISVFDHSLLGNKAPYYVTRSSDSNCCDCVVCDIAHSNFVRLTSVQLPQRKSRGRPRNANLDEGFVYPRPKRFRLCPSCLSRIGKGNEHNCSTSTLLTNMKNIIASPGNSKIAGQLAHEFLKDKENVVSITSNVGGHAMQVCKINSPTSSGVIQEVNSLSRSNVSQLKLKTISNIQNELNLSQRRTLKLCHEIRSVDCKAIESNVKDYLKDVDSHFRSHFEVQTLDFVKMEKHKIVERQPEYAVFCKDINKLIATVCESRGYDRDQCLVKISIDGGGGFLKISMSVFHACEVSEPKVAQKYLDSGVKKILLISIAPNVQENYLNVLKLWVATDLDALIIDETVTIACDLKLANCLSGIMAHGAAHPCTWCNAQKENLEQNGDLRTFESLQRNFWKFHQGGKVMMNAKQFENVIHPAVIKPLNASIPVLFVIPPPELHLLTGPFTTIFDALVKTWPGAESWLEKCNIKRSASHNSFTGNSCMKLLSETDSLASRCPLSCLPFVKALRCFYQVRRVIIIGFIIVYIHILIYSHLIRT